jgi:hypothetical protein
MVSLRYTNRSIILLMSILWIVPGSLHAQLEQLHVRQVDTIETSLDLFNEISPMHITLTLDLKKYQREKYKGKYMPVHFRYELNDTTFLEKDLRLKARGNFRRSHCNLAPFWLDIRNINFDSERTEDIKRVKIVTHCKGSQAYEEYVLKEYLCYKIYNILSPVSFRVRLIRMTYVDTGRKNKTTEGWAFMIEPEEMVAQRNDGISIKRSDLGYGLMRPMVTDVLCLFQYMIGNVDYSVAGRHNIKILGLPGFGSAGYTPVPYDFDYSGAVNAYYAIPTENLGITSVTQRYYLGPCREETAYITAIEHINQYQEVILNLVRDFPYLDPRDRKELIRYLEGYFDLAAHPGSLIHLLESSCF